MDWLIPFYLGGVVATIGWLVFTLGPTRPFMWRGQLGEVLFGVILWPLAIPVMCAWYWWEDR